MHSLRFTPDRSNGSRRLTAILSIIIVLITFLFLMQGLALAQSSQGMDNAEAYRINEHGSAAQPPVDGDGLDDAFDTDQGETLVEPVTSPGQIIVPVYDPDQSAAIRAPNCIGDGTLLATAGVGKSSIMTTTRTISGTVWLDEDFDGLQPGLPATAMIGRIVTCDCFVGDSTVSSGTITTAVRADGTFLFEITDDLPNLEFKLSIDVPDGFGLTKKDVGTDDAIDSDFDPVTKMTDRFLMKVGETADRDAGLVRYTTYLPFIVR